MIKKDTRKKNPLVSIIVPSFNVEKYLEKCIDSLTSQSYKTTEILIIDDGSTDGTTSIAKAYADNHENVFYYYRDNGGLSAARNLGIEKSKGEYIAFVDSDDWVDELYIEKMLDSLLESGADMAVCGFCKEEMENTIYAFEEDSVISPSQAMIDLGKVLMVVAWNKLYKRSVIEGIRYPEGRIHEDEFVAHKVLERTDSVSLVREVLYHYRIRKDSITAGMKYDNIRHLDYLDALEDRLTLIDTEKFADAATNILYMYFEGFEFLLSAFTDKVFDDRRLRALLRKKALRNYLVYFWRLDRYQKKAYPKMIIFLNRARRRALQKSDNDIA